MSKDKSLYIGSNPTKINTYHIDRDINQKFYDLYMEFLNEDSKYSIDQILRKYLDTLIDDSVEYEIIKNKVNYHEALQTKKSYEYSWSLKVHTKNHVVNNSIKLLNIPIPTIDYDFLISGKNKIAVHRLANIKCNLILVDGQFNARVLTDKGLLRLSGSFNESSMLFKPKVSYYDFESKQVVTLDLFALLKQVDNIDSMAFDFKPYNELLKKQGDEEQTAESILTFPDFKLSYSQAYFWQRILYSHDMDHPIQDEYVVNITDFIAIINFIYNSNDSFLSKDSLINKKLCTPVHYVFYQLENMVVYNSTNKPFGIGEIHKIKATLLTFANALRLFTNINLFSTAEGANNLTDTILKLKLHQLVPGELDLQNIKLDIRNFHKTLFGRVCSTETPESNKIGLNIALLPTAKYNLWGDIYTAVYKIEQKGLTIRKTDCPVYIDVYKQHGSLIGDITTLSAQNHVLGFSALDGFMNTIKSKIDYIFVNENQQLSLALQHVPFAGTSSSSRLLMTASQIRQSIALNKGERPYVGTTENWEYATPEIIYRGRYNLILKDKNGHLSIKHHERNQINNSKVYKNLNLGHNGGHTLGTNLIVSYGVYYGNTHEDSCVISSKVINEKKLVSSHQTKFSIPIYQTPFGKEIVTDDLLFHHQGIEKLSSSGIINSRKKVSTGDVLIGKITPISSKKKKNRRMIYQNTSSYLVDTSIKCNIPNLTDGVVQSIKIINNVKQEIEDKNIQNIINEEYQAITTDYNHLYASVINEYIEGTELTVGNKRYTMEDLIQDFRGKRNIKNIKLQEAYKLIEGILQEEEYVKESTLYSPAKDETLLYTIEITIAYTRNVMCGDKVTNRYGSKGIIAKIVDESEMPRLPCGRSIDIIFSPTNLTGRLGLGQLWEVRYGLLIYYIKDEINKLIINYDEKEAKILFDKLNKFFPDALLDYTKEGFVNFEPYFTISHFDRVDVGLIDELKNTFIPNKQWNQKLYDPIANQESYNPVSVGYSYILKLVQTGQSGLSHRSVGGYSTINQQPIKGNPKIDTPQRFGEMDFFALKSWNANHTIQEIVNTSDNILNRQRVYQNLLRHGSTNNPRTSLNTSFEVLNNYLLAANLKLSYVKKDWNASVNDTINIRIATPEDIQAISNGEVKIPDTYNYRTLLPVKDGLFCENLFGSLNNLQCKCGKFEGKEFRGVVCEVCGVKVDYNTARRKNFATIKLYIPVVNLSVGLHHISSILNIPRATVIEVVKENTYVCVQKDKITISANQEPNNNILDYYTGSAGLYNLFKNYSVKDLISKLPKTLQATVQELFENISPLSLFVTDLVVLPPHFRPMIMSNAISYVYHELNVYYRLILYRNRRLKDMVMFNTPYKLMKEDRVNLNIGFNNFVWNGRYFPAYKEGQTELPSIMSLLRGKSGLLRREMTGKRIDYSARAVLIIDTNLSINQCSIPIEVGIKIFEPLILNYIIKHTDNIALNKQDLIKTNKELTLNALDEISKTRKVLIQRAPTLHTLSIQAFQPIFTDSLTIGLSPFVFKAFNADCDGDKLLILATHSDESQKEINDKMYMQNVINPSNNTPIMNFEKELKTGIYLLLREFDTEEEPIKCVNWHELIKTWKEDLGNLNTRYAVRIDGMDTIVTKGQLVMYYEINKTFTINISRVVTFANKQALLRYMMEVYLEDKFRYIKFMQSLQSLSFLVCTLFGLSVSCDDIEEYKENKAPFLSEINTMDEQQILSVGAMLYEDTFNNSLRHISNKVLPNNNLYNLVNSGARGDINLINTVSNYTGTFVDFYGNPMSGIVKNSYHEGLSFMEYVMSASGNRRGLATRALTTAVAGYFTRKMYLLCVNDTIGSLDCGTTTGIEVDMNRVPRYSLLSKYLMQPVFNAENEMIYQPNTLLTDEVLEHIYTLTTTIVVRSPLTCLDLKTCAKCFGAQQGTKDYPLNDSIGMLSAYALTEPGMQGFMDSFKTGGIIQQKMNTSSVVNIQVDHDIMVTFHNMHINKSTTGELINTSLDGYLKLTSVNNPQKYTTIDVPQNSSMLIENGSVYQVGTEGYKTIELYERLMTTIACEAGIVEIHPGYLLIGKNVYRTSARCKILVENGQKVQKGEPLLKMNEKAKKWMMKDLIALLEKNISNDNRQCTIKGGKVKINKIINDTVYLDILQEKEIIESHKVPIDRINVYDNQEIEAFTPISDGNWLNFDTILRHDLKFGLKYIISIISEIVRDIKISISLKHIELIMKRLIICFKKDSKERITTGRLLEENIKEFIVFFKGALQVQKMTLADNSFLDRAVLENAPKVFIASALANTETKLNDSFINMLILGKMYLVDEQNDSVNKNINDTKQPYKKKF